MKNPFAANADVDGTTTPSLYQRYRPWHDKIDLVKTLSLIPIYLGVRYAQQFVATSIDEMDHLHQVKLGSDMPIRSSSASASSHIHFDEWIPGKWEFTRTWPDPHLQHEHRPWMILGIVLLALTLLAYGKEAARISRRCLLTLSIATALRTLIALQRLHIPNSHMICPSFTTKNLHTPRGLRALRLFAYVDGSCAGDAYMPEYVSIFLLLVFSLYSLSGKRLYRSITIMYAIVAFICTSYFGYYLTADILANFAFLTSLWVWFTLAIREKHEDKWWARPAVWVDRVPSRISIIQWKKSVAKELAWEEQQSAEATPDQPTSPSAKRTSIPLDPRGAQRRVSMSPTLK